ncbi:MAG: Long-chain-fatty-acid--CoA ligase [Fibrobacteria bacterium]|jgi:long-chain acyl-CoA synthetase|nr:Long-chain-fatty-acid--CoA ligase [Fibrobacteria bacterium]
MTFPFSTLPGIVQYAGQAYSNPAALCYKSGGRWCRISSSELLNSVRHAGENLIEMGLQPGDRVGIVAEPSPFWLMADLAALGAGAVTVPLFPNAAPEVLRHQISDSGMKFLFVGSEEVQDMIRPIVDSLGSPLKIVLLSSRQVQIVARRLWAENAGSQGSEPLALEWDRRAALLKPENTATLIYTSGSTGMPKGVELTHGNIVSQVRNASLCFPLDPAKDSALSFLPLAHVFERMVTYYYLASGISVAFAESSRLAGANLREIHPTILTAVPRFFQKVYERILGLVDGTSGIRGRIGKAALRRAQEKPLDASLTWKDKVFEALVYRRIRAQMGGRLRLVISGSAPLDAVLAKFLVNLGVPVYEGYGLSESSPVLAVNYPGHRKLGTVGPAFPGVELRIAPDGEVLARGPNIMKGYYGLPEETAAVLDKDGWLHTGDLGSLDEEGYLSVTGRKKELFKSANGKYVAPLPIEQALATHRLIESAVIIAEGRPFVSALIYPDFDSLLALKQDLDGDSRETGSFLQSEAVQRRFAEIVEHVNRGLNSWEQVRKFHVIDTPPAIESGEMTPTLKLRRHAVEAKYHRKIESFYDS